MAARLPYLDRAQVGPEIQSVFDALQKAGGRVLNIFRLMAHHPRSLPPFLAWYPLLREGPLDLKLRYLAYVRASQLNRCRYCVSHNGAAGRRAGVSKEQLDALAES
ncbi:MAG: carboxymuconolactone decarboxylase family protein, partial [Candidatus Rokuibacteriota bacterium]